MQTTIIGVEKSPVFIGKKLYEVPVDIYTGWKQNGLVFGVARINGKDVYVFYNVHAGGYWHPVVTSGRHKNS